MKNKHKTMVKLILALSCMFILSITVYATNLTYKDDFTITTNTSEQRYPFISYDSTNDRYMVVWQDKRNAGNRDIYGEILYSNGTVYKDDFNISTHSKSEGWSAISYDSTNDRFLVAWMLLNNSIPGYNWDIYAKILHSNGLTYKDNFTIAINSAAEQYPKVSYDSTNDRFLMVWNRDGIGIRGKILYSNGTTYKDNFAIQIGNNEHRPVASYDSTNDRFLVVWDYNGIHADILHSNGTTYKDNFSIVIDPDNYMTDSEVDYDSTNDRYMVVWEDYNDVTGDMDIYAEILYSNGTTYKNNFSIVSNPAVEEYDPQITYDSANDRYLVIWVDERNVNWDVYGKILYSNGSIYVDEFNISTYASNKYDLGISFDSTNERYFAAWRDSRSGAGDIYGKILYASLAPITTATAVNDDNSSYTFNILTNSTYVNVTLTCTNVSGFQCNVTLYCTDAINSCIPSTVYSSPVNIATEGISYIRFRSNDSSNNMEAAKSNTIKIDTTNPAISYNTNTDTSGNYSRNNIFVNITASDTNKDSVKLYWNGTAENFQSSSGNLYWSNKTGLSDGIYTFYGWINDSVGHTNQTLTRTVETDTLYPIITFDGGTELDNTYFNRTWIYANWTYTELNLKNITAKIYNSTGSLINQTNFTSAIYEINWTLIDQNEKYYYNITICDNAGNCNDTGTRALILDNTIPAIVYNANTISSGNYSENSAFINITASDTNKDTVLLNWNGTFESFQNNSGNFYWSNKTGLINVTYTFYGWINDSVGNTNQTATRTITIDTIPPAVTINKPTSSQNFTYLNITLNITATDSLAGMDSCWFSLDDFVTNTSFNYANEIIVNVSDGNNTIKIGCNDTLNNLNDSESVVFYAYTKPMYVYPTPADGNTTRNSFIYVNLTTNYSISSCELHLSGVDHSMTLVNSTHCTINQSFASNGSINWNCSVIAVANGYERFGDNRIIYVDTSLPVISVENPLSLQTYSGILQILTTVSDAESGILLVNYTIINSTGSMVDNGTLAAPGYDTTWNASLMPNGLYNLSVYALNNYNFSNTNNVSFYVQSGITVHIILPTNVSYHTDNTTSNFYYSTNTALDWCKYNITNSTDSIFQQNSSDCSGQNFTISHALNFDNSSWVDGNYTINLWGNLTNGDIARTNYLIIIDNTLPYINNDTLSSTSGVVNTDSLNIDLELTETYLITNYPRIEIDIPGIIKINYTMTNIGGRTWRKAYTPNAIGTYNFKAFAEDEAGNTQSLVFTQSYISRAPTGGGAGGGGGAASKIETECGNFICEYGENELNCPVDCKNVTFEIVPKYLRIFVLEDKKYHFTLTVVNEEPEDILVFAEIKQYEEDNLYKSIFINITEFGVIVPAGSKGLAGTKDIDGYLIFEEDYKVSERANIIVSSFGGKRGIIIEATETKGFLEKYLPFIGGFGIIFAGGFVYVLKRKKKKK